MFYGKRFSENSKERHWRFQLRPQPQSPPLKLLFGIAKLASLLPFLAAVLTPVYLWFEFVRSHLWGDQAYLMYAAREMLRGRVLDGPTLIETNPPFAVWFSVLPVTFAHLCHIPPSLGLRTVTLTTMLAVVLWARSLLNLSVGASDQITDVCLSSVWLALLLIQPTFFGQREHFVVLLLLPYVLYSGARPEAQLHRGRACAVGLAAGLAVCFKPQQVLALLALEIFHILHSKTIPRSRRLPIAIAAGTIVIYLLAIRVFADNYYTSVLPRLRDTYWALGTHTLSDMVFRSAGGLTLALVCGWATWLYARRRLKAPLLSGSCLACSSGAAIAYDFQHAAWSYQRIPATQFAGLAFLFLAVDLWWSQEKLDVIRSGFFTKALAVTTVLVVTITGLWPNKANHSVQAQPSTINSELLLLSPHTTVYAFSIQMSHFPIILDRDLRWGSRFAHLWMLPAILENERAPASSNRPFRRLSNEKTQQIALQVRGEIAEDLHRFQPELVFVERCSQISECDAYNGPVSFVTWFSQDAHFVEEWSNYSYAKSLREFDLYRRHPGSSTAEAATKVPGAWH